MTGTKKLSLPETIDLESNGQAIANHQHRQPSSELKRLISRLRQRIEVRP